MASVTADASMAVVPIFFGGERRARWHQRCNSKPSCRARRAKRGGHDRHRCTLGKARFTASSGVAGDSRTLLHAQDLLARGALPGAVRRLQPHSPYEARFNHLDVTLA